MPKKHITGKKVAGSHTTVIDPAQPLIEALVSLEEVYKVVLGSINSRARSGALPRTKCTKISNGWKVRVRAGSNAQTFFVYTNSGEEKVREFIESFYS